MASSAVPAPPPEVPAPAAAARWCQVAVPVPLPGALTYEVPPAWRGAALPGTRVLVPVGRRRLVGVVVALLDAAPRAWKASRCDR